MVSNIPHLFVIGKFSAAHVPQKVPDPTFICGHYNFVLKRKNHIQGHVAS